MLTVRPRKEAEGAIVARNEVLRKNRPQPDDVGDYVAVRQHDPLRLSGGARGVDQGRQLLGVRDVRRHFFVCAICFCGRRNNK